LKTQQKAALSVTNDASKIVLDGFGDSFQSIFPWQDAPGDVRRTAYWMDTSAAESSLVKKLRNFLVDVIWTHSPVVNACIDDNDVLMGGKQAFQAASHAVFGQFSTSTEEADKTRKYDEMKTVFDEKLHGFFQSSIESFLAKNGSMFKLNYSLENVEHVAISNKEVIFGATREMGLGDKIQLKNFLWLFSAFFAAPKEKDNVQLNHNIVTIRYSLDVVCKELFNVQNILTGEITQGDTETVTRTHRVLLENSITFVRDEKHNSVTVESQLDGDWSIVDIDSWLMGNPFWLTEDRDDKELPLSPPS